MAGATLISRLLGLVREMAYARFMGNGWVAGAFLLAFQIPNLFRRLLGEGALTAAFIPVFKETEKRDGEEAMWRCANGVVSGLIVVAAGVVVAGMAGISLALGWGDFENQTRLMLELLRVMFPYTFLVCLAAVCMGMLNARGRFFIPALGAALLNVVMIATVLFWAPGLEGGLERKIHALAWGVLVAGVAQALFQLPALWREGWRPRWISPWREAGAIEVVRRMIPTTVGVAAFQLNMLITQGFAFVLGASIVASFQYAVRLMELPQGLFGVSMATFLLPTLSGLAADRKYEEFRSMLLHGLCHLLLINLLASALLMALARPIVRLLFEGGMFQASATESVAFALMFLAPGLVAFSATGILARAFYALGETRVPMQISVFCLALNTVLSVLFVLALREGGLALANTLTALANAALLGYALKRKFPRLDWSWLWRETRVVLAVAVAVGVGVALLGRGLEGFLGTEGWVARGATVAIPAGVGAIGYGVLLGWLRVRAFRDWLEWAVTSIRRRAGGGGAGADVAEHHE